MTRQPPRRLQPTIDQADPTVFIRGSRRASRLAVVVLMMASALQASRAAAQPPPVPPRPQPLTRTPAELERELEPGSQVEVVVGTERRVVRGKVADISLNDVVIVTGGGVIGLPTDEIHEVWRRRRERFKGKLLAGTLVGVVLATTARLGHPIR